MQGTVLGPGVGVVGLGPLWVYGGLRRLVGYHIMVLQGRCLFNVCVYKFMCVYMFICLYVYMHISLCVYMFIGLYVYVCIYLCVYVYM